jgi:hypothetical protein
LEGFLAGPHFENSDYISATRQAAFIENYSIHLTKPQVALMSEHTLEENGVVVVHNGTVYDGGGVLSFMSGLENSGLENMTPNKGPLEDDAERDSAKGNNTACFTHTADHKKNVNVLKGLRSRMAKEDKIKTGIMKCIDCYLVSDTKIQCRNKRLHTTPGWSTHKCVALIKKRFDHTAGQRGFSLPKGTKGRQLIEEHNLDCPQCREEERMRDHIIGYNQYSDHIKTKTKLKTKQPKTKTKLKTKQPKTKEVEVIQVNSIAEGKALLVAFALEWKLTQSQEKESKFPYVAVAVVPFDVGGVLHTSAFARGHVIVEEDVKSVVNDHTMRCPLLKKREERLGKEHMLRFDYTPILCEMFVHGSDDGDGNHVEPIDIEEYQRLRHNVGNMARATIGRPRDKGGLVAGATEGTKTTLQYTNIAALEANDGIDVIALYEWYGKNTKCAYHDWGTNTLEMNCGAHHLALKQLDRVDYDTELHGDLGAIPYLTQQAYEIDRFDDTVGYCLRNMVRCCFKHNHFVNVLDKAYTSGISKTTMRQSTGSASEDCTSAGRKCETYYRSECICSFHRSTVMKADVFTACEKCICL